MDGGMKHATRNSAINCQFRSSMWWSESAICSHTTGSSGGRSGSFIALGYQSVHFTKRRVYLGVFLGLPPALVFRLAAI